MTHLYNEISIGNENEQIIPTCITVEESYKHHVEQKAIYKRIPFVIEKMPLFSKYKEYGLLWRNEETK